MRHLFGAVGAYVFFNIAVWASIGHGGLIALAAANALGGAITMAMYWRSEIVGRGMPRFWIALLGACGVAGIVGGLRVAHASMPVHLGMEAVYNGFALISWPMFVMLRVFAPTRFTDRPTTVDLVCHGIMASLVTARFWNAQVEWSGQVIAAVCFAITGYAVFNVAIKLAVGHRATNLAMNGFAALLLIILALVAGESASEWSTIHVGAAVLGGTAVFLIVRELGACYRWFGNQGLGSLVAPLVYDGLLIASPVVTLITGGDIHEWPLMLTTAIGMVAVTLFRWWYHTHRK